MLRITKNLVNLHQTPVIQRCISINSPCLVSDIKWRDERGLPENPNSFGPLTNLPDYTFIDGRPTPMGANLSKRLKKQQEIAEKIVKMCKELDYAKKRYVKLQEAKQLEKENIIKNKLKPKGHLLLKKN